MSQTTDQITGTAPAGSPALKDRLGLPRPGVIRSHRPAPWAVALLAAGVAVVTLLAGAITVKLVVSNRTVEPSPRAIKVPYADRPDVWAPFQSWVVQEDGRKKPFQTYCIESVRTITGVERFEKKNDPVAVVVSWMMLTDLTQRLPGDAGKKMGCDWENYPFILCDHHELREAIFPDADPKDTQPGNDGEMSGQEMRFGKYVAPVHLRDSKRFQEILDQAAQNAEKAPGMKYEPTVLESKAREVASRLRLYDLIRAGSAVEGAEGHRPGDFQVVALDRVGSAWFSIRSLEFYSKDFVPPFAPDHRMTPEMIWEGVLAARAEGNEDRYKDPQPLPLKEVKEVLAAYKDMQKAYRSEDADEFKKASAGFLDKVNSVSNEFTTYPGSETTEAELTYNRVNPFQKAWIIALLATLLLGTSVVMSSRWEKPGRGVYWLGMAAYLGAMIYAGIGFGLRCTISGRPPVSNMYESIIFVGSMTAVFGLILELVYRKGIIALAGAAVSTMCLVLADQVPLTFEPGIKPLTAVLRSNYWLIIHVMTIVSSYAALALAWGLGNFNLGLIVFAPQRRDLIKTLSMFSYRAIQIGVILLFLGTMLGGFWAAESWGRFWGWDPKEVWALIAFLSYIIPLHARYIGWIKDFGLAASAVCCFSVVVMAWYGVNFVIGAGLHSYGFGSGGNWFVYLGGLVNIDLVLLAGLRYLYRNATPALETVLPS